MKLQHIYEVLNDLSPEARKALAEAEGNSQGDMYKEGTDVAMQLIQEDVLLLKGIRSRFQLEERVLKQASEKMGNGCYVGFADLSHTPGAYLDHGDDDYVEAPDGDLFFVNWLGLTNRLKEIVKVLETPADELVERRPEELELKESEEPHCTEVIDLVLSGKLVNK